MGYIGNIRSYISSILGFEFEDKGDMRKAIDQFPAPIANLFTGRLLAIGGIEHVLVKSHSSEGTFPMSLLIRRLKSAEEKLQLPCILYLNALDGDQRRQLIKHKVCFIVPDRQIYLPTMGTYFTERRLNSYKEFSMLTPAAQLLVLYYLQKGEVEGIGFKELAERLSYPPKTISMIAAELKQAGLCDIVPLEGRGKSIVFKSKRKELWVQALPMMSSPIDKVGYLSAKADVQASPLSYDDALSHYTDMGYMPQHGYAVEKRSEMGRQLLKKASATNLPDSTRIEFWKYNPATLAKGGFIDPLSMILIYKDHEDERIQGQIERLLEKTL
ncbi:helix-turn-helix domain-containing protein [Bacteroides timonensis]|uniref:MarR family transcriptional regulator n=1 Tax=Bacteroides timonensis TaxID=1470345 RepID=UPI0004B49C79|nr:MarR family transcriptional regulator [Bacteroides timonensis]